jgi:predicted enzyme related to lactoylglutathione lyase
MKAENRIDYVEIPVTDPAKAREFLSAMFGWEFVEWGPDYLSFNDGQLDGGLRRSDTPLPANSILLVFYSEDLERDLARVQELGATISEPIFPFPGGRRFHFVDPVGNEYAIWSEGQDETQQES